MATNQSLQHDTAIAVTQSVIEQLKDDLPYERRLSVMGLLYWSFKGAIEKYEELVERRRVAAASDSECELKDQPPHGWGFPFIGAIWL